jgi:hypothetical protein
MYFHKIRQVESRITEPHVVVVSMETPDGGKAGVFTEVTRQNAAKLVVEGWARLATEEETAQFRAELVEAKRRFDEEQAASQVKFAIVPDHEYRGIKSGSRSNKG